MSASYLDNPEVRRIYEAEVLAGEAMETILALLGSASISQRELADRLGVSESRISQIVNNSENLTLHSLADVGWALGYRFKLDPEAIENRASTPAANDPAPPAWLLARRGQQPQVGFGLLETPAITAGMSLAYELIPVPEHEIAAKGAGTGNDLALAA